MTQKYSFESSLSTCTVEEIIIWSLTDFAILPTDKELNSPRQFLKKQKSSFNYT